MGVHPSSGSVILGLRQSMGGMPVAFRLVPHRLHRRAHTVDLWGATASSEVKRAIRVAAENAPGVREVRDHVGILSSMVRGVMGAE